jgi:two-component system sensor histidine kinase YesM
MYLLICKMRYGDAFTFTIEMEPAILQAKIKKILLQPLLENCVKYGLKRDTQDNLLSVRGRREDGEIVLSVSDSGEGMDGERLQAVRAGMKGEEAGEEAGSFGLRNLYSRLAFAYGDRFSMEIESIRGQGTTVTLRLPGTP